MATGDTLLLEVKDFKDPQHWRWVLKDSQGNFLQDQEVSLDPANPNYHAFLNLQGYLDSNSSPDKRQSDQERLLVKVSDWIGSNVLGKVADRLAQCRTSTIVRVLVPPEASGLAYLPLELARVGDQVLARGDLSLVFESTGSEPTKPEPIGEKLRMLAVFSLPTDEEPLAMRRERYELTRLINRIAQTRSLAIELRVLQYGVTRDNLQDALEEGEGWDIIHISGHGERGSVYLENLDGTSDEISSKELADLLSLARGRLKFITLSSCHSAAATVEETLRWLGLWKPEMDKDKSISETSDGSPMPALAQQLVTSLDCAALAMRYTVGDEFATELMIELYELLLDKGQTLPRSLQLSLRNTLTSGHNAVYNPLSLATPALFGRQAANLVIKPPTIPRSRFQLPLPGLAYFPDEPNKFVDRIGPLISASAALAPESGKKGVLFYGMAGAGKTACALELTYHHSRSQRFQYFVWYKAPDEGKDIDRSLLDLAMEMERRLSGLKIVQAVDDLESFRDILPILSRALEENSILIVLDNLESLLTNQDKWRDERWGLLIDALLEHNGYSRIILTSRRLPQDLNTERLVIRPIHALSLKEAMKLAREMPNLGRLFVGSRTLSPEKGQEVVTRTLELAQGHPKLIALADAQAADAVALEKYLDKAAESWGDGSRLASFFETGVSSQDAEDFLKALKGWTKSLSETLPEAARTLFHFLCSLEEPDRQSWIAERVWPELWKHLGLTGQAPGIDEALQDLKALVEKETLKRGSKYIIHPVVAEAGLEELEDGFRTVLDEEMARFFGGMLEYAKGKEKEGTGRLIVRAGLSAASYLIRLNRWLEAAKVLEEAAKRDPSPGTIASVLIMLRRIIDATRGTDAERKNSRFLARLLIEANRREDAERILRPLIADCVTRGESLLARAAATDLFIILRDRWPEEALVLAEKIRDCTIKLGLGPWTRIHDEGLRYQALNKMGRYSDTLKAVMDLKAQMKVLPEHGQWDEVVETWNVKEIILSTGQEAAINSGSPDQIFELTTELFEIRKSRGATELELARGVFGNYSGLIGLKKYEAAEKLLHLCRNIFEKENDIPDLAKVLGALSILKDNDNQPERAISFGETALRYAYLADNVEDISIMHNNLGNYLAKSRLEKGLAHHLADGIISYLVYRGTMISTLKHLSLDLKLFGPKAIPASFDQLCQIVEELDGVRFRDLFHKLAEPAADGDRIMQKVIEMAKMAGHESGPNLA